MRKSRLSCAGRPSATVGPHLDAATTPRVRGSDLHQFHLETPPLPQPHSPTTPPSDGPLSFTCSQIKSLGAAPSPEAFSLQHHTFSGPSLRLKSSPITNRNHGKHLCCRRRRRASRRCLGCWITCRRNVTASRDDQHVLIGIFYRPSNFSLATRS